MWKYNGNFKKINIVFQIVGKFKAVAEEAFMVNIVTTSVPLTVGVKSTQVTVLAVLQDTRDQRATKVKKCINKIMKIS